VHQSPKDYLRQGFKTGEKDAEAVMALPEVATAYTTDLKKLTFDKSNMPPIVKAVEALKNQHEILVYFDGGYQAVHLGTYRSGLLPLVNFMLCRFCNTFQKRSERIFAVSPTT